MTLQDQLLREKILHILSIYPEVSPGMIQVTLGAGIPAAWWKPVMEQMLTEGMLTRRFRRHTGPGGRDRNYTIISRAAEAEPKRHDVLRHGHGHGSSTPSSPDDARPYEVGVDST